MKTNNTALKKERGLTTLWVPIDLKNEVKVEAAKRNIGVTIFSVDLLKFALQNLSKIKKK